MAAGKFPAKNTDEITFGGFSDGSVSISLCTLHVLPINSDASGSSNSSNSSNHQ